MTWSYAYTPAMWSSVGTAILLLILAAYGWRRRSLPGALPFAISCLFVVLLATGSIMTDLAANPETQNFWRRFEDIWWLPAMTATTCFILEYAWPGRWLTRRNLILLSIVPLLAALYAMTDGFFHLVPISLRTGGSGVGAFGRVGLYLFGYALVLTLINFIVFGWLFIRSPQHRWPVILMATGQIASRISFIVNSPMVAGLIRFVPQFAFPYLAYTLALFWFHIFDPVPLARRTAIEQLSAGMVVVDQRGRIAGLNPAAEQILGLSSHEAKDRPVTGLLPAYAEGEATLQQGQETEFCLETRQNPRCYALALSPLRDFRGLDVGRLLMLRDVTGQKQAQEQIVEQQRVLATLNERERMARELHDSLGQVLSYASLQVETVAKLSRDGREADAAAQLDRLGHVVREAHADLREHILNLHSATSPEKPFCSVVEQYLEGFTSSYDIHTKLTIEPALREQPFSPDAQFQVFRILQEALSNARKHGQARHVQVELAGGEGCACLSITDDGRGFEPDTVALAGDHHYGLQFMRERAVELGGKLRVKSAPGEGTQVVLQFPTTPLTTRSNHESSSGG